jgi:hypothetical protein
MRLFGIEADGAFKEFVKTPFQSNHEEAVLENWLESNPDGIVEDSKLLMIGRQVATNLGSVIDLLALDRQGDVVVLELKRDRTPRETLAQALEYASFVEALDWEQLEDILRSYINDESINLAEYHRQYFELSADEAVSFNKDQRIVIVGQIITDEIRQTSTFLRKKGLRVSCVEFSLFESEGGARMLSHDIVVGKEHARASRISSGSLPIVSKEEFLESLDEHGKPVFQRILGFAESHSFPIHWGTRGFSLNVDIDGTHVVVCFGYPPNSVYKQSLYTAILGRGGLLSKVDVSENVAQSMLSAAQETGLFQPAGRELKCLISREFSDSEITSLLHWCEKVAETIKRHSLQE